MKDISSTLTSKGQIVVPAELRRKHGLAAGTKVKFMEDEFGRIVLQPITEEYIDRVMGCLQGRTNLVAKLKAEHRREGKARP
jgi:AbrB family looped-hinge helix DNA binding protein